MSFSQTIYHTIKVSNISFNSTQKDTLVYIFVERDYLIKQKNELDSIVATYKIQVSDYSLKDKEDKRNYGILQTAFNTSEMNNRVLTDNLDKVTKQRDRRTFIGGVIVAVLTVLYIVK